MEADEGKRGYSNPVGGAIVIERDQKVQARNLTRRPKAKHSKVIEYGPPTQGVVISQLS